jgi:hypothetical protein
MTGRGEKKCRLDKNASLSTFVPIRNNGIVSAIPETRRPGRRLLSGGNGVVS